MIKKIYFEKPSNFIWALIIILKFLKYKIFIFNFDHNLKKYFFLKKFVKNKIVKPIIPLETNYCHGDSIDIANSIVEKLNNNEFKSLITLYSSDEIKLIFKKSIAYSLLQHFETVRIIKKKDLFFKSFFNSNFSKEINKKINLKKIKIWKISKFTSIVEVIFFKIKWKIIAPLYFFFKTLIYFFLSFFGKKIKKKKYKNVISIDSDFQIKFEGLRRFDFILDKKKINKSNTLFLINCKVSKKWIQDQILDGYNIAVTENLSKVFSLDKYRYPKEYYLKILLSILIFIRTKHSSNQFLKSYINSLNIFLNFSPVLYHYSILNYIYTNQEGINQISRNILIKNQGGKSWNYSSFIGGSFLSCKSYSSFYKKRNVLFSFQNPSFFFAVNKDVVKYLKLHNFFKSKFIVLGSIYSQLVKKYTDNKILQIKDLQKIDNKEFFINDNKKIISFFDTTFIDDKNCHTSLDDGINFYDDIYYFSKKYSKKIKIIIKNSKDEDFYSNENNEWSSPKKALRLFKIWNNLKKLKNVYFATDKGNVPLIMSLSDLVVTHCMSSTCIEALGAKINSVWYDTNCKYKHSLYSKIQNLIIHNRVELNKIIFNCIYNSNKLLKIQKKILDHEIVNKLSHRSLDEMRKRIK